jgi:hypothetical protein
MGTIGGKRQTMSQNPLPPKTFDALAVAQATDSPRPDAKEAQARPFQFRLVHLLAVMSVLAVCFTAFAAFYRFATEIHAADASTFRLKSIAIALHNYHDIYGQFPPAYQCDANGQPAHSWRVLIWNLLESQPYASTYNYGEPWNGPSNIQLQDKNRIYRFPFDRMSPPLMTNYVAVTGAGTMWSADNSAKVTDIKDGTSNTLMIVEISNSNIHWMEPRDLPLEDLEDWLDPAHKPQLFGNHITGAWVCLADGSVQALPRDVTIERLREMARIADGK